MSASPYPMMDYAHHGFDSNPLNRESANRRQRISMACSYCRHRKIRCCGGAPCRNCSRSGRDCEYQPVPEEVNRATREKKASARANKAINLGSIASYSPMSMSAYTPYMHQTPTFDVSYTPTPQPLDTQTYLRPPHAAHRRTFSSPVATSGAWSTPPAPLLSSPAMLESSGWMYNACTPPALTPSASTTPSRPYPSVLQAPTPVPTFDYSPAHYTSMTMPAVPTLSTPVEPMHYRIPPPPLDTSGAIGLGISTPITSSFQSQFTPSSSSSSLALETPPQTPSTSAYPYPTSAPHRGLAPPIEVGTPTKTVPRMAAQPLVGLGIGLPPQEDYYPSIAPTPTLHHGYYASPCM